MKKQLLKTNFHSLLYSTLKPVEIFRH